MQHSELAIVHVENGPWLGELQWHCAEKESSVLIKWLQVNPDQRETLGKLINRVVASLNTDFMLWIGPGWRFSGSSLPFCQMSMTVLGMSPVFAQVKLHTEDHQTFEDRSTFSPLPSPEGIATDFRIQSPRKIWGGLTIGPAITTLRALSELGPLSSSPDPEAVAAEFCARSTTGERHLALRHPDLFPFMPSDRPPYKDWSLSVECSQD